MEEVQNTTPTVKRLRDSCLSYIARSAAVSEHRHYCYKIAVSLDNSVNCWIRQSPHIAIKGFIVNQRQVHKCASPEGPVLNTLIEPESTWGKKIKLLLGDRDFVEFEEILDPATIGDIVPSDYAELSNESLGDHIEYLVCQLTGTHPDDVSAVDERIEELVRFISKNLTKKNHTRRPERHYFSLLRTHEASFCRGNGYPAVSLYPMAKTAAGLGRGHQRKKDILGRFHSLRVRRPVPFQPDVQTRVRV